MDTTDILAPYRQTDDSTPGIDGNYHPLHRGQRLNIPRADFTVLNGDLHSRGLGRKATIELAGQRFGVYGRKCGLPHCQCDSELREVK